VTFWQKDIGAKATLKLLMKLTTVRPFFLFGVYQTYNKTMIQDVFLGQFWPLLKCASFFEIA